LQKGSVSNISIGNGFKGSPPCGIFDRGSRFHSLTQAVGLNGMEVDDAKAIMERIKTISVH
jgi:hypothetical protein